MPLFEYICKACGERAELLVTGACRPACPRCGSLQLEKQLSRFNAQVASEHNAFSMPPCGTGSCPGPGGGCASGGCPHTH